MKISEILHDEDFAVYRYVSRLRLRGRSPEEDARLRDILLANNSDGGRACLTEQQSESLRRERERYDQSLENAALRCRELAPTRNLHDVQDAILGVLKTENRRTYRSPDLVKRLRAVVDCATNFPR